ncbi:PBAN-type neuropeptides-like [Onthophagus taurus]|uniref:PBAN-type neuropeptides-like n=1 Tax=Onthophagus taurus TaxID=166361 RepID=UPI0039BDF948
MEHITAIACLLFIACTLGLTPAEHRDDLAKRKSSPGSLWFGPRMGRNKRNPFRSEMLNIGPSCEDLEEYIKAIPWDLVRSCIINEGKRDGRNNNKSNMYIPRLGRESGEEFVNAPGMDKFYDGGAELIREVLAPNSPPFSPRLG